MTLPKPTSTSTPSSSSSTNPRKFLNPNRPNPNLTTKFDDDSFAPDHPSRHIAAQQQEQVDREIEESVAQRLEREVTPKAREGKEGKEGKEGEEGEEGKDGKEEDGEQENGEDDDDDDDDTKTVKG